MQGGDTNLLKWVCVWPQRRPGSLSTDAGGPMGGLGISGSVGSLRRVLYVLVAVEVI